MQRLNRFRFVFLIILLVALNATGSDLTHAEQAADPPSREWKRLSSRNFSVVGTASDKELRSGLVMLEAFRLAIAGRSAAWQFAGPAPVLVLTRNADELTALLNTRRIGAQSLVVSSYLPRPEGPLIVVSARAPVQMLTDLFSGVLSRYARDQLRENFGTLPLWLHRGLGRYHALLVNARNDGVPMLGTPSDMLLRTVRTQALDPVSVLIDPKSPLSVTATGRFDAESWLLVHYLLRARTGRQPKDLGVYVDALNAGQSEPTAFQTAFGLSVIDADRELRAYFKAQRFPASRIDVPADVLPADSATAVPMRESEVHTLLASLFLWTKNLTTAEEHLSSALAQTPSAISVRLALGELRTAQGRSVEAIATLEDVVRDEPTSFAAHSLAGDAYLIAGRYADALEAYRRAGALRPGDRQVLLRMSTTAVALDRRADADAMMERLQRDEPDADLYLDRLKLLWRLGRDADVVRDAEAYVQSPRANQTGSVYLRCIGALAAQRSGQHEESRRLFAAIQPRPLAAGWPENIVLFLTGQLDPTSLVSKAGAHPIYQTEAHTYIGIAASIAGRRDEAITHLTWVQDKGATNDIEFALATAELARIQRAP